jgi:ABC-type transporter Mla subunit MlaD
MTIVIALVVGGAVSLWRAHTPPTRVIAVLPEAPGIMEGLSVEYRGISVGTIEKLRLTEAAVELTLRLERRDLPLRTTDRVAVVTRGLGNRALAIVPSRDAGEAWQPGDTLRAVPPDTIDAERAAAARAILDGAIQKIISRDSLERARGATGRGP